VHWGRGYATEGARAALGHGLGTLGLAQILSIVHPGNARSIRVAEKLEMRPMGRRPIPGGPQLRVYTTAPRPAAPPAHGRRGR
jgi:RimJ/RimL family protein N-acetyltransferase